jgi:hypothetical protein
LFCAQYVPSADALKRYRVHRRIDVEKLTDEDRRRLEEPRSVDVFCPLSPQGQPVLRNPAQAFAFLGTEVWFPIGLNIQADWLLSETRLGIDGLDSNLWHHEILRLVPRLIRAFLEWACAPAQLSEDWHIAIYDCLPDLGAPHDPSHPNNRWVFGKQFAADLRRELSELAFLPVRQAGTRCTRFLQPAQALSLPQPLRFLDTRGHKPWRLFGDRVISGELLGRIGRRVVEEYGLATELTPTELEAIWESGAVGKWYTAQKSEADTVLVRLVAGLARLATDTAWKKARLRCLPTLARGWCSWQDLRHLPHEWLDLPREAPEIRGWLDASLPDQDRIIAPELYARLVTSAEARLYVENIPELSLEDAMAPWWSAVGSPDAERVVTLTRWVLEHWPRNPSVIKKVVCDGGAGLDVRPWSDALLAEPYAGDHRRKLFPDDLPAVSELYLDGHQDLYRWRQFFEQQPELNGPFRLVESFDKLQATDFANRATALVGTAFSLPATKYSPDGLELPDRDVILRYKEFLLVDYQLPEQIQMALDAPLSRDLASHIVAWLDEGRDELRRKPVLAFIYHENIRYYDRCRVEVLDSPAAWVKRLKEKPWIPVEGGADLHLPSSVVLHRSDAPRDAPVAVLPPGLVEALLASGFSPREPGGLGAEWEDISPADRLRREGPHATLETLERLVGEALSAAAEDEEKLSALAIVLMSSPLFPVPERTRALGAENQRVPGDRLVQGGSNLGGWVVPLGAYPADHAVRPILERLFPRVIAVPECATCDQALAFLRWVWSAGPKERDVAAVMPSAYRLVGEQVDAQVWAAARPEAKVYVPDTRERWHPAGPELVFDDLGDAVLAGRLRKAGVPIVRSEHLGDTREEQARAAAMLGLSPLSQSYRLDEEVDGDLTPAPAHWQQGLEQILKFVACAASDGSASVPAGVSLVRCEGIRKVLSHQGAVQQSWPVWAAWQLGKLVVAGTPLDFSRDLSAVLLRTPGAGAQGLEAEVAHLLANLDDAAGLGRHLARYSEERDVAPAPATAPALGRVAPQEAPAAEPVTDSADSRERQLASLRAIQRNTEKKIGGLLTVGVLPSQRAFKAKRRRGGKKGDGADDAPQRLAAMEHEQAAGRFPVEMPPSQDRYDIDSFTDAEHKHLERRIEVKGTVELWVAGKGVRLSEPQLREALIFRRDHRGAEPTPDYWVYVVEPGDGGRLVVHPLRNPTRKRPRFELRGGTWRDLAEKTAKLSADVHDGCTPEAQTEAGGESLPMDVPIPESYWVVVGRLLAGHYPGALNDGDEASAKLSRLLDAGIRHFVDLTEEGELTAYQPRLEELAAARGVDVVHERAPIRDYAVPAHEHMKKILDSIDGAHAAGRAVYVHCHGGRGRTGTVVGCYLVRHGLVGEAALGRIMELRKGTPKGAMSSPESAEQFAMVRSWPATS